MADLFGDTHERSPAVSRAHGAALPRSGEAGAVAAPDSTTIQQTGSSSLRGGAAFLIEEVADGECVAIPRRSGGAFDESGVRGCDVRRAQDVLALVGSFRGRWVMISLTVNRDEWTNAETAYQACNERVRRVAAAVSKHGIYATAFEVQTKTGEGWPHWHLVVWVPDVERRSNGEIRRAVEAAWRIQHCWAEVDETTGELVRRRGCSQSIGFSSCRFAVDDARSVAGYCAKYLMKPWPAVPVWMLKGRRQLRKLRLSRGCFEWLERVGRHVPTGPRVVKLGPHRRYRRRSLLDRMVTSGTKLDVLRRVGWQWRYAGSVPFAPTIEGVSAMCAAGGVDLRPHQGRPESKRFVLGRDAERRVLSEAFKARAERSAAEFRQVRRGMLLAKWSIVQGSAEAVCFGGTVEAVASVEGVGDG
jgi:hypothetical protein